MSEQELSQAQQLDLVIDRLPKLSTATNSHDFLEDIIKEILAEPKRVVMQTWLSTTQEDEETCEPEPVSCGAIGCIAGHVVLTRQLWRLQRYSTESTAQRFILQQYKDKPIYKDKNGKSSETPWREGVSSIARDLDRLFVCHELASYLGVSNYKLKDLKPRTQEYAEEVVKFIRLFMARWEEELKRIQLPPPGYLTMDEYRANAERVARNLALADKEEYFAGYESGLEKPLAKREPGQESILPKVEQTSELTEPVKERVEAGDE